MVEDIKHLLYCLGEECGEVQQVVGKSGRFGLYDTHPVDGTVNFSRLRAEMNDLVAVWEMLCEEIREDPEFDRMAIDKKKEKVSRYWHERQ